ncbi:hypothetical protein ACH4MG_38505, partial [Streptomyces sp. NPDC017454]|uniref:hypothetical protein n=1 Tax=Streptomyces sp. NPDC017454 TaxID=3364997 RepID=UPI0037B26390
ETSDISINGSGASLVALHARHPIGGQLEEAQCSYALVVVLMGWLIEVAVALKDLLWPAPQERSPLCCEAGQVTA